MTTGPRYEPYLDTPGEAFRWRLGLRPLDLDDWLQFDEHAEAELAEKQRLLAAHPETVFRVDPGDDMWAASEEILAAIQAAVPAEYQPQHHQHPSQPVENQATRESLHPLDRAGRMVQEDLVVMIKRDGELICGGGSVCFPNRWDLASKVGLSMAAVHAPVPDLNPQLETAIDRSLQRLTPERPFWRLGWTVIDTDDLYQPTNGTAPSPEPTDDPSDYWLRVERETLRRFPITDAVLFTIRTYLSQVRDIPPTSRHRMAAALESMDPEILDYKALGDAGERVAAWLRSSSVTIE